LLYAEEVRFLRLALEEDGLLGALEYAGLDEPQDQSNPEKTTKYTIFFNCFIFTFAIFSFKVLLRAIYLTIK
jgi:hypothetical protein